MFTSSIKTIVEASTSSKITFIFKNIIFEATENPDGSLTFSNVNVSSMKLSSLKELPWSSYSWSVKENFNCSINKLINLSGCPTSVERDFDCSYNQLISLEGCQTSIKGKFKSDNFSHEDYLSYIMKKKINQL